LKRHTFKITLSYDGTAFNGWQIQEQRRRTVQGELRTALRQILKTDVIVIGSGRTDSGVHAAGQVAHFSATTRLTPSEMQRALNGNLPDDIAVLAVAKVRTGFHAQFDAKRKTYRYTILNRPVRPVSERLYCLHVPYPLNLAAMRAEAKCLVGKKDFRSFMAANPALADKGESKDTVRRVHELTLRRQGDWIIIDITANGFLYKMVRNIVGTLIAVGLGQLPKGSMQKILTAQDRTQAHDTAPAKGLTLLRVEY